MMKFYLATSAYIYMKYSFLTKGCIRSFCKEDWMLYFFTNF